MNQLGNLEETVLLIAMFRDDVYGVTVAEEYKRLTGLPISVPAIHTVLRRLEQKGYLRSRMGDATPQRGGRRKRLYEPTAFGYSVTREIRNQRIKLWGRIPKLRIG
jgi:DNA-binding PadR family transcriptional regulator